MNSSRRIRRAGGFTLIELLVVVLIIGILASIAVPQYFKLIERGRAAEGLACLSTVKGGQQRRQLKAGAYFQSGNTSQLDTPCPTMRWYNDATFGGSGSNYTATIVRNASANGSYGSYTFTFNSGSNAITCTNGTTGTCSDLLP